MYLKEMVARVRLVSEAEQLFEAMVEEKGFEALSSRFPLLAGRLRSIRKPAAV